MKHRFLVTAMASIMLLGGTGAVSAVTAQPVQAISKHSWHWHEVKTTKDVKVYKLRYPLYKAPKFSFWLVKGSYVDVRYFGNNHYYEVRGDLGRGTHIVKGSSTRWFRNA
ncbi:hypothetical protein [Lactobacillus crispatus]|uniref:hypothetical protein n=1 Tax=Lactobacillus crispatus TaxID=47770 RepID=UPI001F08CE66|nr:hypothetical protein [Lactobacillus crispatus]